jgi:hypothetical protein
VGGPGKDGPMSIQHPNAKNAYVTHEGRFFEHPQRMILVVETDLRTNPAHPDFNAHAVSGLIEAIQAYVIAQNRKILEFRLVPTSDRI